MIRCQRCRRPLRHPVEIAGMSFGAKCAQYLYGAKPRRVRADRKPDERQAELPLEVLNA